jgi:hypothetical protein
LLFGVPCLRIIKQYFNAGPCTTPQSRQPLPGEQITEHRVNNCGITRMKFPLWQLPEVLSRNYMYFRMYFHWLISPETVFRNWLKIMN